MQAPRTGEQDPPANLFRQRLPRNIEERYLAQAVDAQDLEVRLLALERSRP